MLQHVTLELRREDWPAAKEFWSIVGFEEVEPPGTLGERSAWVERNGTQIHLQWQDDPVAPPEGHPAVVVDDWDAVVARLQDEGYEGVAVAAQKALRLLHTKERSRLHVLLGRALDRRDRVVLRRPGAIA